VRIWILVALISKNDNPRQDDPRKDPEFPLSITALPADLGSCILVSVIDLLMAAEADR
jgi:hypothetical protein